MQRKRSHRLMPAMLVCMLFAFVMLTSGCGGSQQSQQQASQNKTQLDAALQHARNIGVPDSSLQPVIKQEQQLSSTSAPSTLSDDSPATTYYLNQAKGYHQLLVQLQGIVSKVTGDTSTLAQMDMQQFQGAIARAQKLQVGNISAFTTEYKNDQNLLSSAQYPKDYIAVSNDASRASRALELLSSTNAQLVLFKNTIGQMKAAHIDVTAMLAQYQSDLDTLNSITTSTDFSNLSSLIDAQYQMAVVNSLQTLPFVGNAKLKEFQNQIDLLKTYGLNTSAYQKLYNADAQAMRGATTLNDYLTVAKKIDADLATMNNDMTQGAANYLIGELDREANAWGQAHLYHDKSDGNNYILDSGYTMNGIGYWLQQELGWASYSGDYQSVLNDEKDQFFNFSMMQQDYSDPTPYNQVHATDLQIFQHYPSLQHGKVLMVSMVEQSMRVYQDGHLIRAFYVTTGRVELPSLPGYWTPLDRKSPTKFTSTEPPGSPYWYPPTPIHYAILYHSDGYFVHDAWWRVNFGPGSQFPHYDTGGDESFAGNGSHGCINMQENDAAWVYANTDWNTQIMVY